MVQVINAPERRPSFLQSILGSAVEEFFPAMQKQREMQRMQEQIGQENQALQKMGIDLSGIQSPDIRKEMVKASLSGDKGQNKKFEEMASLSGAMDALGRMKQLRKKGNLGIGSSYTGIISPDVRKDAGEYEQLGKSLIQYATNIPIRNRIEFETLAEQLYDPTISDSRAEGILDAMERIINNSISKYSDFPSSNSMISQPNNQQSKERPPLSTFRKK